MQEKRMVSINQRLSTFREQGANVIVPFEVPEQRVDRYHEFHLAVVQVDPNPDGNDIWYVGTKKDTKYYCLHKSAIQRMGFAMGIMWDPDRTRRLDDMSNPDYVAYQAVGFIRGPDGRLKPIKGDYSLDLKAVEAELEDQHLTKVYADNFRPPKKYAPLLKGKSKEEIAQFLAGREILQWRRWKEERAQTGAMLRAIKSVGLPTTFTVDQLKKPFVFIRVDRSSEPVDYEGAATLHTAVEAETSDLYGGESPEGAEEAKAAVSVGEKPDLFASGIPVPDEENMWP